MKSFFDQAFGYESESAAEAPAQPEVPVSASLEQTQQPAVSLFDQAFLQDMQPEADRLVDRSGPDAAGAHIRYAGRYDMNARPRNLPDERVADESWAEAMQAGAVSIGGSIWEAVGSVAASVPEAIARTADEATLLFTPDDKELPLLREMAQREAELGYRSQLASMIRQATKLDPEDVVEGFWTRDLPSALGYTAAFLGGGVAGTAVRAPLWLISGALGSTSVGLEGYEDAKQHLMRQGVSALDATEQTRAAYAINAAGGWSNALPLNRVFDRMNKFSGGLLQKNLAAKMLKWMPEGTVKGELTKEAAKGFIEEAVQETFEQSLQNWVAGSSPWAYDEDRSIAENLGKAAAAGGSIGALLSVTAGALGIRLRNGRTVVDAKQTDPQALLDHLTNHPDKEFAARALNQDPEYQKLSAELSGQNIGPTTAFVDLAHDIDRLTVDETLQDPEGAQKRITTLLGQLKDKAFLQQEAQERRRPIALGLAQQLGYTGAGGKDLSNWILGQRKALANRWRQRKVTNEWQGLQQTAMTAILENDAVVARKTLARMQKLVQSPTRLTQELGLSQPGGWTPETGYLWPLEGGLERIARMRGESGLVEETLQRILTQRKLGEMAGDDIAQKMQDLQSKINALSPQDQQTLRAFEQNELEFPRTSLSAIQGHSEDSVWNDAVADGTVDRLVNGPDNILSHSQDTPSTGSIFGERVVATLYEKLTKLLEATDIKLLITHEKTPGFWGQAGLMYHQNAKGERVPVFNIRLNPGLPRASSTAAHEVGHEMDILLEKVVRLQAEHETKLGRKHTPAQRVSAAYNYIRQLFSYSLVQDKWTVQDFINRASARDPRVSMYQRLNVDDAAPVFPNLVLAQKKEGFSDPHYSLRHNEHFADMFSRWLHGAVEGAPVDIWKELEIDPGTIDPELVKNVEDFRQKLAALPPGSHAFFAELFQEFGRLKKERAIVDSVNNPVTSQFISELFKGQLTIREFAQEVGGWEADLDRFNWFIKLTATLPQLGKLNGHIKELGEYIRQTRLMDAFRKRVEAEGVALVDESRKLGKVRSNLVFRTLIEETTNGKFLTDMERAARFQDQKAELYYKRVRAHFSSILNQMEAVALDQVKERFQADPEMQIQKIKEVGDAFRQMKAKPYFPLMRFGRHAVEVRNRGTNKLEEYHLFETEAEARDALRELRDEYGEEKFSTSQHPVKPADPQMMGLPFHFVESLALKYEQSGMPLTPEQLKVMKELSYEYLPAKSFMRQFKQRRGVEGYSFDGLRILGAYTQSASGHLARVKFGELLEKQIKKLRENARFIDAIAPAEVKDRAKRHQIANELQLHYQYLMTPENELAALRSLGFVLYLGFNVKSALVNLSQLLQTTYPYLAARYGEAKAVPEIGRAMLSVRDFFGKSSSLSQEEQALIHRGKVEGWLDESLAATLAVISQDGAIDRMLPVDPRGNWTARELGKRGRHFYTKFAHYSALPFQVVEKYNRYATALAAYRLARMAGADVEQATQATYDAVETTQFEYSRWARPNLFRGKKGALFLFKSYTQGMLFFLGNDPGKWRALGILVTLAGLQGLPFAEDLLDLMDAAGTKWRELMGLPDPKVDLRVQLRKEAAELTKEIGVNPDLFFRGISSRSMGLGLLEEMGLSGLPNVDLSGSLSLGDIVPGTGALKQKTMRGMPEEFVGRLAEEMGGPLAAAGMGILSPWIRNDPDKWRKWERALPMFARNASKALRLYNRGAEQTAGGAIIAEFDPHDTGDMLELAFQAVGFTPTKLARGWESHLAELEVMSYWSTRKATAMLHYNFATEAIDREAQADALAAIERYNKIVPYPEMQISAADVRQSWRTYHSRREKEEQGLALQRDFIRLREDYAKAYAGVVSEEPAADPGEGSRNTALASPTAPWFGTQ